MENFQDLLLKTTARDVCYPVMPASMKLTMNMTAIMPIMTRGVFPL
jgi:hypothetical protein